MNPSRPSPAFRTASDKSWSWRPGNEATHRVGLCVVWNKYIHSKMSICKAIQTPLKEVLPKNISIILFLYLNLLWILPYDNLTHSTPPSFFLFSLFPSILYPPPILPFFHLSNLPWRMPFHTWSDHNFLTVTTWPAAHKHLHNAWKPQLNKDVNL